MKSKDRTFNQIKKEKTLEDLDRFAKQVTERVATSEEECSQKDIARDNNLTPKGLRDLMDYAIITGKVSLEIAIMVKNKAIKNQQRKAYEAGGSSIMHHKKIVKQREEFLAGTFSRVKIKEIADDIAYNPSKPIQYFTGKYQLESNRMTKLILKRAIVENIVTDEVMELIIKRSQGINPPEKVKHVFQMFREERNRYKNSH